MDFDECERDAFFGLIFLKALFAGRLILASKRNYRLTSIFKKNMSLVYFIFKKIDFFFVFKINFIKVFL